MKIASAQQTAQWFEPQTEKARSDSAAARAKLGKVPGRRAATLLQAQPIPKSGPLNAVTAELSNARTQL
jgi:hypothetical protein